MSEFMTGLLAGAFLGFMAGLLVMGLIAMAKLDPIEEGKDPDPDREFTK